MPLALKQPIVQDPSGTLHPDAVYVVADIHMAVIVSQGNVEWRAYHDAAALLAGDECLPECGHNTVLSVADNARVSAYVPPAGTPPDYASQTGAALVFAAQAVLDTTATNADGTPRLDAQGQPVMVAFFAGAQVISIG